jgi:hypothetical protein
VVLLTTETSGIEREREGVCQKKKKKHTKTPTQDHTEEDIAQDEERKLLDRATTHNSVIEQQHTYRPSEKGNMKNTYSSRATCCNVMTAFPLPIQATND